MSKKLILSEEEKKELAEYNYLEVTRGGHVIVITKNDYDEYDIHVSNPYNEESIYIQMAKYFEKNQKI